MKSFIIRIVVVLIISAWFILAVVGVISAETAVLVPVGILIGSLLTIWFFGIGRDSQEKEDE